MFDFFFFLNRSHFSPFFSISLLMFFLPPAFSSSDVFGSFLFLLLSKVKLVIKGSLGLLRPNIASGMSHLLFFLISFSLFRKRILYSFNLSWTKLELKLKTGFACL